MLSWSDANPCLISVSYVPAADTLRRTYPTQEEEVRCEPNTCHYW